MTATRIVRPATLAAAAAIWLLAASLLWRTSVPSHLHVPALDPRTVFPRSAIAAGVRFDRFYDVDWVLATLVALATLFVTVRRGPRFVRALGLGPVNAGIITAVLVTVVVWASTLPFGLAASWWSRRHAISKESWGAILFAPWGALLRTTFTTVLVFAVLLLLAKRFAHGWWAPAAGVVLALAVTLQLLLPYVQRIGAHGVRDPRLAAQIQRLERRERVGRPTVRVVPVKGRTTAANAFSIGIGPARGVFIWDTMLDGRFTQREIDFVVAHELGHLARHHTWKGIGWGVLLGTPTLIFLALVTGRRGGLRDPTTVPLALLALTLAGLAVMPLANAVSRRYETEADWAALTATRDPAAARGLFRAFVATDLQNPDPPGWVHVFLEDHPSALARVEQAEAWRRRNR